MNLFKVTCKKTSLILCGVAIVAILAGCSSAPTQAPATSTPTATAPAAKPAPSPTASQPASQVIELKFSSYTPETHLVNQRIINPFVQAVDKRTGGKVKIKVYPSETLGKTADQFDIVRNGTADFALVGAGQTPGRFPLATLIELPFIVPSSSLGTETVWRMYKDGYFKTELGDVEMLAIVTSPPVSIMSKKPIATLDDLKGMKIRTSSGGQSKVLTAVGASAISMSSSDVYLALDKGTIDASAMSVGSVLSSKLQEVSKYFYECGMGPSLMLFPINKATWAKLPPDAQGVIKQLSEEVVRWYTLAYETDELLGKGTLSQAKVQVSRISDTDRSKWIGLARPIWEESTAALDGKGLPGKATLDYMLKTLTQLGVKF